MKTALKESIWLIGIAVVSILIYRLYLGNSAADISMHDTYIITDGGIVVSSGGMLAFTWFIVFGFIVYLTRALFFEFKMIVTSIILICFTALCLYFSPYILHILHAPDRPPILSVTTTEHPVFNHYISPTHAWFPVFVRIFMIVVLVVASFNIGKGFKTSSAK